MYINRCQRNRLDLNLSELSLKRLIQLVFIVSICFYNFVSEFIYFTKSRVVFLNFVGAQEPSAGGVAGEADSRFDHLFEIKESRDKDVRCKIYISRFYTKTDHLTA